MTRQTILPHVGMRAIAAILVATLLAGCGLSREARIEKKLEEAGLKPRLAQCMARKLDEKLSTGELEELNRAVKAQRDVAAAGNGDGDHHHIKIGELAERLQSIDDPHIVDVVTRAGFGCTILG